MPDWEAELKDLLARLDVTFERGNPDDDSDLGPDQLTTVLRHQFPRDHSSSAPLDSVLEDEVSAVRTEMEATLERVMRLTRFGQLDRAVRDDIVFVLRALTRPQQETCADDEDEWQITSAAAVLHFCRAIMRLTYRLAPGLER